MTTTTVSPGKSLTLESLAKDAGIDLEAAKKDLAQLDDAFGGQHGPIPEGALIQWTEKFFGGSAMRAMALAWARALENEHAATLPPERKRERELTPEAWRKAEDERLAKEKAQKAKVAV